MKPRLTPVYVIFLLDREGNLEWTYTEPKPFYYSHEEAEKERQELMKKEKTVTENNSMVQKIWRLE